MENRMDDRVIGASLAALFFTILIAWCFVLFRTACWILSIV
jgi:hypothetical protein